jgi:divalent metal cation (Fe/Co/Zn/Cd) transporter
VSAVALGTAAVAEISASLLSGSASVLADGLHNSGDVMTSFILLFTFALVRRPATRRFSSGYGRFEDVATLLIIVIIIATAAVAAAESVAKLIYPVSYSNIPNQPRRSPSRCSRQPGRVRVQVEGRSWNRVGIANGGRRPLTN